jgi:hypothetical protein
MGTEFRRRYMVENSLFGPEYEPEEILVISSDVNRTIMSAESFLDGLFPAGTGPKIAVDLRPPMNIQDIDIIEARLNGDAVGSCQQPVPIHTIPRSEDSMFHGVKNPPCPRAGQLVKEATATEAFKAKEAQWA